MKHLLALRAQRCDAAAEAPTGYRVKLILPLAFIFIRSRSDFMDERNRRRKNTRSLAIRNVKIDDCGESDIFLVKITSADEINGKVNSVCVETIDAKITSQTIPNVYGIRSCICVALSE